ncbi:MAG TPA: T9SS type A sorting domain-containing protein, partial [Chitinophagaceae bacterium]|nr:T9SS type A sorting domain-containing protein [Chitinophagaceae bacterium]
NGDKVCTENYIKNWVSYLNQQKPGYGFFSNAVLSCEGPDSSFHYAWNDGYNPDYRAAPGNKNVYEWLIQFSRGGSNPPPPPPPPTGTPNCSTVNVIPMTGALKVKGLISPVATVQVFNNAWATVFNQTYTNSPDSITVPSLANGTYHVKVTFYTAAWSQICSVTIDAAVGPSGPPPPPPPPPGGTPDCSKITFTSLAKAIKIKGLVAPVISVQLFNNNWTTAFNQTYTNSPDSITISNLSAGTYHAKVTFNNSSWAFVCEKLQDVTVTSTGNPSPAGGGVETMLNERVRELTGRVISVAPNPFVSSLTVSVASIKNERATISVMDLSGRPVYTKSINLQRGMNRINLNEINNIRTGSYYLRLVTSEGVQSIRLIRQ